MEIVIPIVLGLTQTIKDSGLVPKKYLQLVAIALAVGAFWFFNTYPEVFNTYAGLLAAVLTPKIYDTIKDATTPKDQ